MVLRWGTPWLILVPGMLARQLLHGASAVQAAAAHMQEVHRTSSANAYAPFWVAARAAIHEAQFGEEPASEAVRRLDFEIVLETQPERLHVTDRVAGCAILVNGARSCNDKLRCHSDGDLVVREVEFTQAALRKQPLDRRGVRDPVAEESEHLRRIHEDGEPAIADLVARQVDGIQRDRRGAPLLQQSALSSKPRAPPLQVCAVHLGGRQMPVDSRDWPTLWLDPTQAFAPTSLHVIERASVRFTRVRPVPRVPANHPQVGHGRDEQIPR